MMVGFGHHRLIYSAYCNYYFLFSNELQRGSRFRLHHLGDALCILIRKEFDRKILAGDLLYFHFFVRVYCQGGF